MADDPLLHDVVAAAAVFPQTLPALQARVAACFAHLQPDPAALTAALTEMASLV